MATPEILAWSTDRGYLYVASSDEPTARFRLETGSEFVAEPAYGKPHVVCANLAGEVFVLDESTGFRQWRYSTGFPVVRPPAVVGKRVFVTNEKPALYAIDAATGEELWEVAGITQFAAASQKRVYGIDDLGRLMVLDAESGALLGQMATDGLANALTNDQTDRLVLVSDDGLVQSLREVGMKEPLHHHQPAEPRPEQPAQPGDYNGETGRPPEQQPEQPKVTPPKAGDEGDPFADEPAEGADEPVEDTKAGPAEEGSEQPQPPADESPFGVDSEDPFGS
jgi:outer membrane protein assembly factor BamB